MFNVTCRILPSMSLKKLSNLVDSIEQDHYSRKAYFCGQNYIGTGSPGDLTII